MAGKVMIGEWQRQQEVWEEQERLEKLEKEEEKQKEAAKGKSPNWWKARFDFFPKDFAVEEKEVREGLVLGGGRDIAAVGEVEEEGLDLRCAYFGRVAFAVEEDETAHSLHVGGLSVVGIGFQPQGFTELTKSFFATGLDFLSVVWYSKTI